MDVFSIISLIGGLTFFLYGMRVMSVGLEKMAGGKLEVILKKMTSNPLKSMALGLGITAVIQSSSAVTVMLVGMVNSGIMQLNQVIGIIMGSNIGTTMTAWILSLVGIEGDNFWIKLLKPENFSLVFAFAGIVMIMMAKKKKQKDLGSILIGFAILMFGMKMMSDSVKPLAQNEAFGKMLIAFSNPILGVLAGAVFTGIIQSSSASVGILQALSLTGSVTYGAAIPIIMGQNIGTCVTALLSSIGVTKNARKVAVIHMSFNIIGTIVCMVIFYILNAMIDFRFVDNSIGVVGVAAVHSVFNIVSTMILFPFSKQLEKLANRFVKSDTEKENNFIDERLLQTPSVAVSECSRLADEMNCMAMETIRKSFLLLTNYTDEMAAKVLENEDRLDIFEDKLGCYLVQISGKDISDSDSREISKLLHSIGDFERLGDHAVNIYRVAKELHEKNIAFSGAAENEVKILVDAIEEIMLMTENAFHESNVGTAAEVEPLEQVIDLLTTEIKSNHIERLRNGECTIEMGFVLSDLLNNCERISDHCSNIAVAVIEMDEATILRIAGEGGKHIDSHEYLRKVKTMQDETVREEFDKYRKRYDLA